MKVCRTLCSTPLLCGHIYPTCHKQKERETFVSLSWSGYQDSNLGPPAPKAGALTGLRYIPIGL